MPEAKRELKPADWRIDDLKFADYNPRKIKNSNLLVLKKSIIKNPDFFDVRRVIVNVHPDRYGTIIGGHMRVLAAKDAGLKTVPVFEVSVDEKQEKIWNVTDNGQLGDWDNDRLAELVTQDPMAFETALPSDMIDNIVNDYDAGNQKTASEEDQIKEIAERNPITKVGDVWELGEHRLVCGDSTSSKDLEKLFGSGKPEMIFTDPPYGIGYKYANHDDSDNEKNAELVKKVFDLHDCGKVWTPGLMNLARDIARFGQTRVAAWCKKFAASGNALGGASTWEPILIIKPSQKKLRNDVIVVKTERESVGDISLRKLHPCPKPIELFAHLVSSLSKRNDVIFDPFGGSGTTMIACERVGRQARLMEIDPGYCDATIARYVFYTKDAKLKRNGKPYEWDGPVITIEGVLDSLG